MQSLKEYIEDEQFASSCQDILNEAIGGTIDVPYTFDIYNEGPKNKNFEITKKNIYKAYFKIKGNHYSSEVMLQVPAKEITYKKFPTKETTNNWTEIPGIRDYTLAGAWYSAKFGNLKWKYDRDWENWLRMIKPYMKGKISVTIDDSGIKSGLAQDTYLVIKVNNNEFQKEREDKIKEMKDPSNLKKWADEADAKEKAEIERIEKEKKEHEEAQANFKKWWKSLSKDDRLRYSMGYYGGSGNWTGD